MDETEALRILSALANGTHPATGEIFPHDSPYQSPNIIRSLFVAVRSLEVRSQGGRPQENRNQENRLQAAASAHRSSGPAKDSSKDIARNPAYGNAGKTWSADEDRQLLAEFDAGRSLAEIGQLHGRTQNGVRARLEKHGRLEPSPATRWPSERSTTGRSTTGRSTTGRSTASRSASAGRSEATT